MGLLDRFIRWRLGRIVRREVDNPPQMDYTTRVEFDDAGVRLLGVEGRPAILWADLRAVVVVTSDLGPLADDIHYVLMGEKHDCVIPSESAGVDGLISRLFRLPGFDEATYSEHICCTENKWFVCWVSPDASEVLRGRLRPR